ncbi:hypothetical protein L9F63_011656, partial [Diploptera punctata]
VYASCLESMLHVSSLCFMSRFYASCLFLHKYSFLVFVISSFFCKKTVFYFCFSYYNIFLLCYVKLPFLNLCWRHIMLYNKFLNTCNLYMFQMYFFFYICFSYYNIFLL